MARLSELSDHAGQYTSEALCLEIEMAKLRVQRDFWKKKQEERSWADKIIGYVLGDPQADIQQQRVEGLERLMADPQGVIRRLMQEDNPHRSDDGLASMIRIVPEKELAEMLQRHGIELGGRSVYTAVRDLPPCESQMVVPLAIEQIKRRLEESDLRPLCGIEDARISEEHGMHADVREALQQALENGLCDTPEADGSERDEDEVLPLPVFPFPPSPTQRSVP